MADPVDPAQGPRRLIIGTTALIAAIWTGIFGVSAAASYLMPQQVFVLLALGLVLGTILTLAVLAFTLRMAEIVVGRPGGGEVVVDGAGSASAPTESSAAADAPAETEA